MSGDPILTKLEDGVLTITLNRPEKSNSLTTGIMLEFADIFVQVNSNDDIRCVVVTGAGDFFCSGADISGGLVGFDVARVQELASKEYDKDEINDLSPGSKIALNIYGCLKPVIAAINGPAAGVGATMILPMDYRLIADTAKVGFVFTRRGFVPEAGSSWLLPRIVGITKACDWILSGRLIEPHELLDAGLVTGIYKAEDLLPAAYTIAHEIIANTSAVSIAASRQLLWRMYGMTQLEDATAMETSCFVDMLVSPDAAEGMQAFMEKRSPKFPGLVTKNMPRVFSWWGKKPRE